jgi:lipopolysaccharide export system protein LptA
MGISSILAAALAAAAGVFTVTADSATGAGSEDGEYVVDLVGNVQVDDGTVYITSDSARVWQQAGVADFRGGVEAVSDTLRATADRLRYDRTSGTALLQGNAVLTDGSHVLTADEVTWFRPMGKAIARGSVHMTGPWLGDVTGSYAMFDSDRGSIFVTSDPVLRRLEEGDSLIITADRLEFLPDSDRAEAQGNAVLRYPSQDVVATAEFLSYSGEDESLELIGAAVVTSPEAELSGSRMTAVLAGGEIESMRIDGAATGHMVDDGVDPPAETWFDSETAFFAFEGGEPDSVDLAGSVTMTWKAGGEAAAREEGNTVSGQRLVVVYAGGSPDMVVVTGAVTGTYTYLGGE